MFHVKHPRLSPQIASMFHVKHSPTARLLPGGAAHSGRHGCARGLTLCRQRRISARKRRLRWTAGFAAWARTKLKAHTPSADEPKDASSGRGLLSRRVDMARTSPLKFFQEVRTEVAK